MRLAHQAAWTAIAVCLAAGAGAPALAQEAQDSTSSPSASGIEEIIVTASRRAESLQDESRQISAVSAEDLARNSASGPDAFAALVPGLSIGKAGPQYQIYIRGVGDRSVNAFGDPAVAPSLDGIYVPRSFALSGLFFDLERVEVVKGPQGTLYGRNAPAGALNLISARPTRALGGSVGGEPGNWAATRVAGGLAGGGAPGPARRAAGPIGDRSGSLSAGTPAKKPQPARLSALFEPSSDFSLGLSATYAHQGGLGAGPVTLPLADTDDRFVGAADPRAHALYDKLNPSGSAIRPGADIFLDTDTWLLSANLDWAFVDGAKLTIVPGYVYARNRSRHFVPGIPYDQDQVSKQTSLEARISSDNDGPLEWVIGGFYSSEDTTDDTEYSTSKTVTIHRIFPELDDETWAVFGEGKFSVTDDFRVIGGLRYTWEHKVVDGTSQTTIAGTPRPAGAIYGENTWDAVNYRVGVEYDAAPETMLFATVSTGFKAGGFYGSLPPNTYRPERLTSYEAGMRSRFLDGRLQLNIDAFYWDYSDRQESFVGIVTGGATAFVTTNAGSARLYGADVSLIALIGESGRFTADVAYLNSRYEDYVFDTNPTPARTACVLGAPSDPRLTASVDCSGFQLVRAPTWSGRVSYQHGIDLASGAQILLTAQTRFSSSYWLAPDFLPVERTDPYHSSDLMVTYLTPSRALEVSAYVRNIENEAIYTQAAQSSGVDGLVLATVQAPRTYGVRARFRF